MPPMRRPSSSDTAHQNGSSYSLTHLARRWNLSRREIRQMLQRGDLPFEQVMGQFRVPCQAVKRIEKKLQRPVGRLSSN
jgi:hypothetical protein